MPASGRASLLFESSGAVLSADAILVGPSAARSNSVYILQAKAAASTRPVAECFVESQRPRIMEAVEPLIVEVNPPELRYNLSLDDPNELRAAWRCVMGTCDPPDEIEVLI